MVERSDRGENARRISGPKKLFFSSVVLLILLSAFGGGYWLGRFKTAEELSLAIARFDQFATLGEVLDSGEWKSVADCFLDPASTLREMDRITWVARPVPTPFLGSGAMPGYEGQINRDQFRYPRDLVVPKPPEIYRVFVVGGSVAFGSGVRRHEQTIAGFLEDLWGEFDENRELEVVTAAFPGWVSTHEAILIERVLNRTEPDLIIAISGQNDVFWGIRGRDLDALRIGAEEYYWEIIQSAFKTSGRPPLEDPVETRQERVPPEALSAHILRNIRASALASRRAGAHYVYCLQPNALIGGKELSVGESRRIDAQERPTGQAPYQRAVYRRVARSLRGEDVVSFVDLTDAFDAFDASVDIYIDAVHTGDRGNRILARAIGSKLAEFGFMGF